MTSRSEYLSYFNLASDPFSREIATEQLLLLPSIDRHLAAAELLIETRGIGVVTGKSGTGKSTLIRLLIDRLQPGLYKSYYVCHTSVALVEFYTHLCSVFGLSPGNRRASMFRAIKEHVLTMRSSSHIHPVLIIDEAHLLNNDILAEIRLLTNFHTDSLNALTVLLCGNEQLPRRFGLSTLESLASAITVTISMEPLRKEETFTYIESRLSVCGAASPLITKNALELIHQASGGIMRAVGTIATASLRKTYLAKHQQVEAEHVQSVLQR
jgi:type II secretory pathway predicted ATPase ExeA